VQPVKTIAIALDFSNGDEKLIAHAIAQGSNNVQYVLIHIIESATAKYLEKMWMMMKHEQTKNV
jgi:manganese transport protein